MKSFSKQDIINYYDQTEVHYRMYWKFQESMGLHYGVWDSTVSTLAESILNTNKLLGQMAGLKPEHKVLDAGCGVGGTAVYFAKNIGCSVHGITLSKKQVATATGFAKQLGLQDKLTFSEMDYTKMSFPDNSFDAVVAIESMQTATDKTDFIKEVSRVLKPGGRLIIADVFKSYDYNIDEFPVMGTMINGWAMSDVVTSDQFRTLCLEHGFATMEVNNVTKEVYPCVKRIYFSGIVGFFGTKIYNFFRKASYFSRIHYTTALAQYTAYKKKLWEYHLVCVTKK